MKTENEQKKIAKRFETGTTRKMLKFQFTSSTSHHITSYCNHLTIFSCVNAHCFAGRERMYQERMYNVHRQENRRRKKHMARTRHRKYKNSSQVRFTIPHQLAYEPGYYHLA